MYFNVCVSDSFFCFVISLGSFLEISKEFFPFLVSLLTLLLSFSLQLADEQCYASAAPERH